MAEEKDPLQGNEGASKQRIEELKAMNLEGAKAKATLEGLAGAFKSLGKETSSLSDFQQSNAAKAIQSNGEIAGQIKSFSKNYKENINLSKELSGFTVNQLKDSKTRAAFEKQVLKAENEQVSVAAELQRLKEQALEIDSQKDAIGIQFDAQNEKAKQAQIDLNSLLQEQKDIGAAMASQRQAAVDDQFASENRIRDLSSELLKSQEERNALSKRQAALRTKEGRAAFEEAEGRKLSDKVIEKIIAAQQQKLNKEFQFQKALEKSINHQREKILVAKEEVVEADKTVEALKEIVEKQEESVATAKEARKALGDQADDLEAQYQTTVLLAEKQQEAANAIKNGLDGAKDLSAEIKKVDEASGDFLKSIEKMGDVLGQTVPVFGSLFQTVFGEMGNSVKMFEEAVAQGTSKAKASFTALTGAIKALSIAGLVAFAKLAFDGAKISSEAFKTVKKGLGGGLIDASMAMKSASGAASAMGIPLQEAAGYIGQMNDALGTSLGFSAKQVTVFGTLTRNMGVSADTAAKLFKFSVKTGTSYEDMAANVAGTTEKLNAMNGTAIAPKAVFEELGNASQTILRNMKGNPDALIKAAAGARAMGMEMNKIADAAESTLDFESSMAKEMEAELMLGKDLNLDKLRAAAATGDQVTMQEEMKRLVMENKGALEGNVLAQGKMADTLGISKEELNKMLNTTEDQAKMAEKDAARKKANAENEKKTNRELGQQQLQTFKSINSLADRIQKFQDSLALGAKNFFDSFMAGIKPLTDLMKDVFDSENFSEGFDKFKAGIIPALKETFSKVSTLVKDSIMEGLGGISDGLTKEGDSILSKGGILGKMLGGLVVGGLGLTLAVKGGKNLYKAGKNLLGIFTGKKKGMNNVDVINGAAKVTMAGGGMLDSLTKGLKPRSVKSMKFTKGLSKIFGGKNTMVGRQLRNMAAMFGKRSSMFKQVFSGMTKTFKVGGPKMLSGLSSAFKTGGPKVLSGLGKTLSKLKVPPGAATGLLKGIGGKILAPLELVMGAVKGAGQVAGKTAEEKKAAGIKESMGTTEAGIIGALTGGAEKGSMFSETLGIEKGGAGDEALGIATAGARGAMTGAAIGSIIPGIGTAVGAAVGGAVGLISEGFKVFSDPNSTLRKGLSEFASNTWSKAKEIGNKVKEGAKMVGARISEFAGNVKDKAVQLATSVGEGIYNFGSSVNDKIVNFGSSVATGIMSFADTARDKAKAFAGAVGEKIGNIKGKIGEFLEANDGLVGGIRAAASGLASKASDWFGSKVQGLKDWWNGDSSDKSKDAAPEIKEAEIKKVTTPLVNMSAQQSKELMGALNTAMAKGAEATVKAVNTFGDNIEPFITESKATAESQLKELREMQKKSNDEHRKEMAAAKIQIAYLAEISQKKVADIKMDSYYVSKALNSNY